MRYWYRTADGSLTAEVTREVERGHAGFGQTPDVTLPAPLACCKFNGQDVVVDAGLLADYKARLAREIAEQSVAAVPGTVSTPAGEFAIAAADIPALLLMAHAAPPSVTLRKTDGTSATLTAAQLLRVLGALGERATAAFTTRDSRLNQLAAATAADLR